MMPIDGINFGRRGFRVSMAIRSLVTAGGVLLLFCSDAHAQAQQLPAKMEQQIEALRQIAGTILEHEGRLRAARAKVAGGERVPLPNLLAELTPPARQLARAVKEAKTILAGATGAPGEVPPDTQQLILARSQEIMAAGAEFQNALNTLNEECSVWTQFDTWPAESFDGLRAYQMQLLAAVNGVILPALGDESGKSRGQYAKQWLALERKHGAAAILDILVQGDSSQAALDELKTAIREVMGDDVELIAVRHTAKNSLLCAVAPSLRVEDLQAIDVAGEHVLLPHVNMLLIKRQPPDGPRIMSMEESQRMWREHQKQFETPIGGHLLDPGTTLGPGGPNWSAVPRDPSFSRGSPTDPRVPAPKGMEVTIDFMNPHPTDDPDLNWLGPIADKVRSVVTDRRVMTHFVGNDRITGTISPVPDFHALCDALNDVEYFMVMSRDESTGTVTVRVDWDAVQPRSRQAEQEAIEREYREIREEMREEREEFDERIRRTQEEMRASRNKRNPQPGDADYESHLIELFITGGHFEQKDAAKALLGVDRESLSREQRGKVAKAFLRYYEDRDGLNENIAIRGLVKFGGRHATKYLIETVRTSDWEVNTLIYQALAKYPSEEAAAAVASRLGKRREAGLAAETLIKMGALAEPAAIEALRTPDEDVALAAIYVLEQVGTEEAMSILAVARDAGNREVKDAAVKARTAIRKRRKS